MARGGISAKIVAWTQSVIGAVPGSVGLTTVGACTLFGAISGSSAATVATIGRLMYGPLRAAGYDQRFALALITASAGIDMVIPPSITMILYGAAADQPINLLFIAGMLPGLLLAGLMGLYVSVHALRHRIPRGLAFDGRRFIAASRDGIWALLMPVVILGGIYTGVFSPTESGGVACVYAVLVSRFVYRSIDLRGLLNAAVTTVSLTAQVFIIVAAAALFSWVLTVSGATQKLTAFFAGLQVAPWLGLLTINLMLLIVGCFIDPASAILVLTPILVPVLKVMGVDLIHFGIIMTVNLEIGMFTPPFGLNIFVTQAIWRTSPMDLYRGLLPFIGVNIVALMIITYWPDLSLWLVRVLG
jgi:C4-dicarboxylate transporter DctM subunit